MASLAEIQSIVQQIHQDLPALIQRARINPQQVVLIEGISDLSDRLGLIQAGEFRTGNSLEPGFGFSGVRIGYPPFSYSGELWNIVGVENDVLQIGIRASDGKMIAGGGDVIIDQFGVSFLNQEGNLTFEDTNGSLNTLVISSDADNFIVLTNAFGGKGITFLIDDAAHNVTQMDFTDAGIDLYDGYVNIPTGQTYNINGIPHTHSTTDLTNVASGTYAPTCTAVANVDATSAVADFTYMRVGNSVLVSGNLNSDATAAGAVTRVRVSLPVASNFTSTGDLTGTGGIEGADDVVIALADTTNDAADVRYTANGTANTVIRIMFMYVVK
jgi:hypothetical protein